MVRAGRKVNGEGVIDLDLSARKGSDRMSIHLRIDLYFTSARESTHPDPLVLISSVSNGGLSRLANVNNNVFRLGNVCLGSCIMIPAWIIICSGIAQSTSARRSSPLVCKIVKVTGAYHFDVLVEQEDGVFVSIAFDPLRIQWETGIRIRRDIVSLA